MAWETIQVRLSLEEHQTAAREGMDRYQAIHARNAKPHNQVIAPPTNYMLGAMGEIAFSKWSGLPWTASKGGDYRRTEPDVGNCEVKTRSYDSNRMLQARLQDLDKYPPSQIYVLCWADIQKPMVELVGFSTLGFIQEYGEWYEPWKVWHLPPELTVDLRELHGRES